MKVALFVEGSVAYSSAGSDPLTELWRILAVDVALGRAFDVVYGISKAQLVSMSSGVSSVSSLGEAFDYYLQRVIERDGIDRAVVAWDLHPKWNSHSARCRWEETLELYRGLASSPALPASWKYEAQQRLQALQARARPSARLGPPAKVQHSVLPLCMDSMFESLLCDENLVREALGVVGTNVKGWPTRWGSSVPNPDSAILAPAVAAVRRKFPKGAASRHVRRDWRSGKNDWGLYLVQKATASPHLLARLQRHPIAERLAEVTP